MERAGGKDCPGLITPGSWQGEVKQSSDLRQHIWNVPETIAFLSKYDKVMTGNGRRYFSIGTECRTYRDTHKITPAMLDCA
jgi:hypothetical protein